MSKNKAVGYYDNPICVKEQHDWDTYTVSVGYGSNEIEQAGYCLRCGYDTHGEYFDTVVKDVVKGC